MFRSCVLNIMVCLLCATALSKQQVRYDCLTGAVYSRCVMIIHQVVKLDMLRCVFMSISVLVELQRRLARPRSHR